jgi:cytochrome c oxidase accessory protein FixG
MKVYPRRVSGRFRRARSLISLVLQVILFAGPWLQWHGRQAILFDLARRRFYFFSVAFWPQETYFVHIILVFLAILLFVSTAVAGRMWCGYACPQTLLTDSFVAVEHFFERDRASMMRLDRAPWTRDKLARKMGKWAVWTGMAVWLGITFVAYFVPARQLLIELMTGQAAISTLVVVAFFAMAALFDFGWFREQMCVYACPYARFQGAMFDANTLIVGYDRARGEPRGKARDNSKGDCVDCTMCVQVCPTGIDIRNGLQLECIACTSCLDACDSVMDRLGRPRGLIRYSSENALEGKPTQLLRPRVLVYAGMLAALATLFAVLLAHRSLLAVDVVREPGAPTRTADGMIANLYTINLMNKDFEPHVVRLGVEDVAGARVVAPQNPLTLPPDTAVPVRAFIVHEPAGMGLVTHLQVTAHDVGNPAFSARAPASFLTTGVKP